MKTERLEAIVKLGGSAITDKSREFTSKPVVIRQLAKEIATSKISCVIIHGGGSYGHPAAAKYKIVNGFRTSSQIFGLVETHKSMVELNHQVIEALLDEGCPALGVAPWACFVTTNGRIEESFVKPIARAIAAGSAPVLYGDIVFDKSLGFTILSGDQIASFLAIKLRPKRLVFALEAGGFLSRTTHREEPEIVLSLTLSELRNYARRSSSKTEGRDVTGGMRTKLLECIPVVEGGVNVAFAAISPKDNLRSAIKGKPFKGTFISGGSSR